MEDTGRQTFYQLLQLSPQGLWAAIHKTSGKERARLWAAMTVRALLVVGFAVAFIAGLMPVFGPENSSLLVGGFCMLLAIKFVPFGYRAKDSVLALALTLSLTVLGGMVAGLGMPLVALACNLVFLAAILVMVTRDPAMGNAGTYVFAYIFVSQTPVAGHALALRWALAGLVLVLCSAVLVHRHRHVGADVRLADVLAEVDPRDPRTLWQMRMAVGVAAVLFVGAALDVPRSVWMGYACMSVLLPYGADAQGGRAALRRGAKRGAGVAVGSGLYCVLTALLPPAAQGLLGTGAGICMGFSSRYFWNNVLICFGALALASATLGTAGSAVVRVGENALGIGLALVAASTWSRLAARLSEDGAAA